MSSNLSPGSVHLWRADLDRSEEADEFPLSRDELERAHRFRFHRDRVRWARCRALLRELLASYLGGEPGRLRFTTGPNGKPRLAGGEGIEFNLSHAGEIAIFAFARDNRVGVDVEIRGRALDSLGAAELVLGQAELERLRSLPDRLREKEFLRSWVRYEAALKCRGDHLGAETSRGDLHVVDLDLAPCAAGALALERAPEAIHVHQLDSARSERRRIRVAA